MKKKYVLLLFGVFLILTNAVNVSSALTDGLIACYDFDGDTTDLAGNYDLTDTGFNFVPGYSGQAVQGTNSDVAYSETIHEALLGDITVITRINTTRDTSTNLPFLGLINTTGGSYDGFFIAQRRNNDGGNANKLYGAIYENEAGSNVYSQVINDGSWHYVALQMNDTGDDIILSIDNTFYNQTKVFSWDLGKEFQVGKYASSTTYLDTVSSIDEVMVYNRSLTKEEITEIYSNNYVCSDLLGSSPTDIPSLQIFSNLADTINVNYDLLFTYNGTIANTNTTFNCSLYIDSVLNQTDQDINITLSQNFTWEIGSFEGNYSIEINCSNDEVTNTTGVYYYAIDPFVPEIEMITGFTNNTQLIKDTDLLLTFNISDNELFAYNLSILDINGIKQENYFTENLTLTSYLNTTTRILATTGNYSVRAEAWDSHNPIDKKVKNLTWYTNSIDLFAEDFTFEGDIKFYKDEKQVTYFYLEDNKHKLKITFNEDKFTHYLNLTATGNLIYTTDYGYQGHFVYLPKKRYIDFEGNNIDSISVVYEDGKYKLEINLIEESDEIELESIGDLNYISKTWYYQVVSQDTLYLAQLVALQTQTNTLLNNVYNAISMIAFVMLYLGLMVFGYQLLQTSDFFLGLTLYTMSLGLDFYNVVWLYTQLSTSMVASGWESAMAFAGMVIYTVSALFKVITTFILKVRARRV